MSQPSRTEFPEQIAGVLGLSGTAGAPRWYRSRWIVMALSIAVLVLVVWVVLARRSAARSVAYESAPVERRDLILNVSATGTLEAKNTVDVGTEVSGTVTAVLVDFNDRVTRGQLLLRLNTDQLEATVTQSRGSLESAEAALLRAQATAIEVQSRVERVRQLAAQGVMTREESEAAEAAASRAAAEVASAQAQVTVARAGLESNSLMLQKAVIRSPIDGFVLSRQVEPGQTIAATFQAPVLFRLATDLSHLELRVDIDEADIGQVEEGQTATFTVEAFPGREFPARLVSVRNDARTVAGVVSYEAVLDVDNPDLRLRPGLTALARITTRTLPGLLVVPNRALRFRPPSVPAEGEQPTGGPTSASSAVVWVLEGGKPTPIRVTTGASDGEWTEITKDELERGTQVLVAVASP